MMLFVIHVVAIVVFIKMLDILFSKERELRRRLCSERHAYCQTSPTREYADLDLKYYDAVRDEMLAHGFSFMGDFEDVTQKRIFPSLRTFHRLLLSSDGTVTARVCHIRYRRFFGLLQIVGLLRRNLKLLELKTEFADRVFLTTTNQCEDSSERCSGIIRRHLPWGTPFKAVLANHIAGCRNLQRRGSGVQPLHFLTLEHIFDSESRMTGLMSASMRTYETQDEACGEESDADDTEDVNIS